MHASETAAASRPTDPGAGGLDLRQAALLVAVTLRGGTVDADVFSVLASRLEVADAALPEDLRNVATDP